MENPKIRFKGFTKDWEQRKLGDVVEFYNGDRSSRYPNDRDIVSEGIPFINAGDLVSGRVKLDTANKITEEKYNELSGAKIQHGDIIYCLRGTLGKNAFVDNFDIGTVASSLVDIRPKKIVGKYLFQVLNSDIEYRQRTVNDEGAAQPNLSAKNLSLFDIPMPTDDEQEKIASYFDNFDKLITLHQRKCEQTKKLKKYMLQKMFPQNGAKVPEIRFDGFTYDWEQRKLSELLEKYEDPVETPHDGYERVGIRSHAKGTFHSFVEPGKELDTAKMYRVAADKFILNITFAWEHAVAITDNNDAGKLVSHRFPQFSFNPKLKPHFFKYLMLDKKFREHLELSSPGGAGRNRVLKISDMLKYEIKLPSIEEQIKIGEYFDSLDYLITLHQRKCDELKKMKKYMLQNMFI